MTSYVVNPSQKVTELLSQYLEFDSNQLRVAIWSGHLQLQNVQLKASSLNPLLEPYHLELRQGTIGHLELTIPWKRFVLGQGKVQVELKQVSIELTVRKGDESTMMNPPQNVKQDEEEDSALNYNCTNGNPEGRVSRHKKQKRLQEAETRLLRGKPLASWLRLLRKKDEEQLERSTSTSSTTSNSSPANSNQNQNSTTPTTTAPAASWMLQKWKSVFHDYVWKLWAGLQMNLQDVQIRFRQDDVELGLVVPNIQVRTQRKGGANPTATTTSDAESSHPSSSHHLNSKESKEDKVDNDPDWEQLEKQLTIEQLGIFLRKTAPFSASTESPPSPPERVQVIMTKEYILCPTDAQIQFRLRIPIPPEKRKTKSSSKTPQQQDVVPSTLNNPQEPGTTAKSLSSTSSSKQRRGKREKQPDETTLASTPPPPTGTGGRRSSETGRPRTSSMPRQSSLTHGRTPTPPNVSAALPPPSSTRPSHRRRNSLLVGTTPLMASSSSQMMTTTSGSPKGSHHHRRHLTGSLSHAITTSSTSSSHNPHVTVTLPLAQPHDWQSLSQTTTTMTTATTAHVVPQTTARIQVTVKRIVVCLSTRHAQGLSKFVAGAVRRSRGRPLTTIRQALRQHSRDEEDLEDEDEDNPPVGRPRLTRSLHLSRGGGDQGADPVRLALQSTARPTERSRVVQAWWQYAGMAVLRQLRQRDQVRKAFQKRFLLFDWNQQKRHRAQYVSLFIQHRLNKNDSTATKTSEETLEPSAESVLMAMEDELCIEQVLLYRAIARMVHVRGGTEMPCSLTEIVSVDERIVNQFRNGHRKSSSPRSGQSGDLFPHTEVAGPLRALEEQFELTRQRKLDPDNDDGHPKRLPSLSTLGWFAMKRDHSVAADVDDVSFATSKTTDTRVLSMHESTKNNKKKDDIYSTLAFSSVFRVEEFEFRVVEEELYAGPEQNQLGDLSSQSGEESKDDSKAMTIVSNLTDDMLFSKHNESYYVVDETSHKSETASKNDYLIFGVPEKILLRVSLLKTELSVSGKTGEFTRTNFSVSRLDAVGENETPLVTVGAAAKANTLQNAFSLTIVTKQTGGTSIQCDAATLRLCADPFSYNRCMDFAMQAKPVLPGMLLPKSAREEVRIYVLRESSQSVLSRVNASIRVHGVELTLPEETVTCVLRSEIIEFYSGTSVPVLGSSAETQTIPEDTEALDGFRKSHTRSLRMMQPADMEAISTPLAHQWVVAMSGIDFTVTSDDVSMKFLQEPVDIEALLAINSNVVFDFNQPKVEVLARISPVHLSLSERRLAYLQTGLGAWLDGASKEQGEDFQPRLDVLSRFVIFAIDVSISRLRIGLASNELLAPANPHHVKKEEMAGFLDHFLTAVSCFDLSFPHEEALSAAMQICIDRLAGLGMPLDVAWQAANDAMLHFLEQMAIEQNVDFDKSYDLTSSNFTTVKREEVELRKAIESAVRTTVLNFAGMLVETEIQLFPQDVTIDLADGIQLTAVQLYYDRYLHVEVPCVFAANGEGIHLLRLTSSEVMEEDEKESKISESINSFESESSPLPSKGGFCLRRFTADKKAPFGRGGLPLAILASDSNTAGDEVRRSRESLDDVDLGELEVFLSRQLMEDFTDLLAKLFARFLSDTNDDDENDDSGTIDNHLLTACTSVSVMLLTDEVNPFSRIFMQEMVLHSATEWYVRSNGLDLFDLAPGSDNYTTIIARLSSESLRDRFSPLQIAKECNSIHVRLYGHQIVFLQKYLDEVQQFLFSKEFGILNVFTNENLDSSINSEDTSLEHQENLEASSTRIQLEFTDCSLLLPRSTTSPDILALESRLIIVDVGLSETTFSMPNGIAGLQVGQLVSEDESPENCFSRTVVQVKEARLFTSLLESNIDQESDHPSFFYFFEIAGRASADQNVYTSREHPDKTSIPDEIADETLFRGSRCWREISVSPISIDAVVDYAPHLRILLKNPDDKLGDFSLNMRLSQYCLLLSVYYHNMQELPRMFPFSPDSLRTASQLPLSPDLYPDLGSDEMKDMLLKPLEYTSEFCVVYEKIAFRYTFDCYNQDGRLLGESAGSTLVLHGAVLHFTKDRMGVSRCGIGSMTASLTDETCSHKDAIYVPCFRELPPWADLCFGLEQNYNNLSHALQQPFQFTVFMTPSWSLMNLGLHGAELKLTDFSPVWRLLEFVGAYTADKMHNNPFFDALSQIKSLKKSLREQLGIQDESYSPKPKVCEGTDFRLWLTSPIVAIPCLSSNIVNIRANGGFWFKYTSTSSFSAQEIVSGGISMGFKEGRSRERTVVDELTLAVRIDTNFESDHTDYSIQIPFAEEAACSFTSPRLVVSPSPVPSPSVCNYDADPRRYLGPRVCELTCIVEALPSVSAAITGLLSLETQHVEKEEGAKTSNATSSLAANVGDLRLFALDPMLGPHLPVAVVSVAEVEITLSQFSQSKKTAKRPRECAPNDLNAVANFHFWADYFKLGVTRSWEPLMEAYKITALWEKSIYRGNGVTLASDCPLHCNVSGAFLSVFNQVVGLYGRLIRDTFGTSSRTSVPREQERDETAQSLQETYHDLPLVHKKQKSSDHSERMAFSLKNVTGHRMRLYRYESLAEEHAPSAVVTYVESNGIVKLSFQASVSSIQNMLIKEVQYPAFSETSEEVVPHVVDVQLPGCSWIKGLKVDTFGRSFAAIEPCSQQLQKLVASDWRLENLMKVLVEVGLEKGGRQVAVCSLFSVINKTMHSVNVLCHPDQQHSSVFEEEENDQRGIISPEQSFEVPALLLLDALRRDSKNLGALWIKPHKLADDITKSFCGSHDSADPEDNFSVNFSSRPVFLSKIVNESAAIFDMNHGRDVPPELARTGVQVSCPVVQNTGDRLAPFCYAVEVGRSPIVEGVFHGPVNKQDRAHGPILYTLSIHPPFVFANLLPKKCRFELMHAVQRKVLWFAEVDPGEEVTVHSVGLDSPLLLLLNMGFCRTPVGEGALVHHGSDRIVGVRENTGGFKVIGKAGKAVTKQIGKTLTAIGESPDKRAQERLAKARSQHFQKNKAADTKEHKNLVSSADDFGNSNSGTDGNLYRVDSSVFLPQDVADETSVVDSIGQKLTLNIENIRGGGGQRRVSVYCPFWIVNSTEHPLRYKQENSKTFVSGTVHSRERDGSVPLTSLRHHEKISTERHHPEETSREGLFPRKIFSGTPGALSCHNAGVCDVPSDEVARLLDSNLPLDELSELAFMFSFQEELSLGINAQRLCMQLGDGIGTTQVQSDWSRGLNLESVGISQVISMHCKDGRTLDLTIALYVAPGILSGYTTIVRILPRFVMVNTLPYPVRVWQDSSIFRPYPTSEANDFHGDVKWKFRTDSDRNVNQYESLWGREATLDNGLDGKIVASTSASKSALYLATVDSAQMLPFILPDSRGERQLRFGFGGLYKLTASISADVAGDHILTLTRNMDLRLVPHVSTRASPEYRVTLAAGQPGFAGELGVWFETEWGSSRRIIVKGIKKPSHAFNETDIHIGDELLRIDETSVVRQTFSEIMATLRARLNEISRVQEVPTIRHLRRASMRLVGRPQTEPQRGTAPNCRALVLVFRTVEERLRRVRFKAAQASVMPIANASIPLAMKSVDGEMAQSTRETPLAFIRAEVKTIHHMTFVVLREDKNPPFEIQNQTFSTTIHFRQKGCVGHTWYSLKPGETCGYAWQEPLKTKRLNVRVESGTAFNLENESVNQEKRKVGLNQVQDEEDALFSQAISVRLEEIGSRDLLQWHDRKSGRLNWFEFEVDVVGGTRVLVARDITQENDRLSKWQHYVDLLQEKIEEESERCNRLATLNNEVIDRATNIYEPIGSDMSSYDLAKVASKHVVDFSETTSVITARHQVSVEVLEATGLSSDSFVGDCNPYVEIKLKSGHSVRRSLFKRVNVRRTYYVRRSTNPTWENQRFIFDVPEGAVDVPRGHSIGIRVRNFRSFGFDKVLGKAQVDLHSLRSQDPLTGWFPLAGRSGRRELDNQLSHWGRGSIRLRVQWIYSIPALMQYFTLLSENRLEALRTRQDGLMQQMQQRRAAQAKQMNASDGFQAVRLQDLIRVPKNKLAGANELISGANELITRSGKDVVKTLMRPLRSGKQADTLKPNIRKKRGILLSLSSANGQGPLDQASLSRAKSSVVAHGVTPGFAMGFDNLGQSRRNLKKSTNKATEIKKAPTPPLVEGQKTSVSELHSWNLAYLMFNDDDLDIEIDNGRVDASLKTERFVMERQSRETDPSSQKLGVDLLLPPIMHSFAKKQAQSFAMARNSFERAARRSFSAILNEGGWLTIRPLKALNLPDNFTGVHVKVRFGPTVMTTQTVDARVAPVWSSATSAPQDKGQHRGNQTKDSLRSNDMRCRVSPQATSGWIRLSIVAEKGQQQLQSKAEIGIVYLPLGPLLAACLDSEKMNANDPDYQRWFPLMSPEESVPFEGGGGLIPRAPEREQKDWADFRDYYRPCIQLAFNWQSDKEGEVPAEQNKRRALRIATFSVKSYFKADLSRISAALIDSERAFELLSFNIQNVDTRYWVTAAKTRFALSIHWVQVDHQEENAKETIALAPTPTDSFLPVIQVFAVKDNQRSTEIVSLDFIDVSIAEFDVTIEERLLFHLYVFFRSLNVKKGNEIISSADDDGSMQDMNIRGEEPGLVWYLENGFSTNETSKKIYVEQLFLGVVKFNLSYVKGKRNNWDLKHRPGHSVYRQIEEAVQMFSHHTTSDVFAAWSRQTSDEDRIAEDKGLQSLPKLFASLFPNVSDAPVRLQGKALNHVFESPFEILQSIRKFYVNETMRQVYKIIGSLDFVGNPTMLVSSVVTGFKDLVAAPSAAFMRSPMDASGVGIGVAKGTLSLFSHSTSGCFAVFTKVSATAAQIIANLSLDADFSDWHRDKIVVEATNIKRHWKQRGVQSVSYMVVRPVADIAYGVLGGAFGLVLSPAKGLQKDGAAGFAKGVVIGATGVVIRPLVGVLDAMAHLSASIHDIAKSVNILEKRHQPALRIRLAYTFGLMNILTPFDCRMARADVLIRKFAMKKSKRVKALVKEIVVHAEVLPNSSGDTYAIITNTRVIMVRLKKDKSGQLTPFLCWELYFDEGTIASKIVDHGHSGVALNIKLTRAPTIDVEGSDRAIPRTLSSPEIIKFSSRLVRRTVSFARVLEDDSSSESVDSAKEAEAVEDVEEVEEEEGEEGENIEEDNLPVRTASKEFDHFTGRGQEGELLEWFTVLAEYQFRTQLGRFHNALCCTVGDFDAVMQDPAFGRHGLESAEGYTSFGIYNFNRTHTNVESSVSGIPDRIQDIPWVTDDVFDRASDLNAEDQQTILENERYHTDYNKRLQASEKEGGPQWLVEARAWALSLQLDSNKKKEKSTLPDIVDAESASIPGSSSSSSSSVSGSSTERMRPRLDMTSSNPVLTKSMRLSPQYGEDSDDRVGLDGSITFEPLHGKSQADFCDDSREGSKGNGLVDSSAQLSTESLSEEPLTRRSLLAKQASGQSMANSFVSAQEVADDTGHISLSRFLSADQSDEPWSLQDRQSISTPNDGTNLTPRRRAVRRRRSSNSHPAPEDRIGRMEALMERLISFTTEQTLQQREGKQSDIALLREEIHELKQEVQKKSTSDDTAAQVAELREEIAWLKGRLQEDNGESLNVVEPTASEPEESKKKRRLFSVRLRKERSLGGTDSSES